MPDAFYESPCANSGPKRKTLWQTNAEARAKCAKAGNRIRVGPRSNATIAAIDGAACGFIGTDPAGSLHQISWDAARDLGPGYTNTVTLWLDNSPMGSAWCYFGKARSYAAMIAGLAWRLSPVPPREALTLNARATMGL